MEKIKIVAKIVRNGDTCLVLNRMPDYLYEKHDTVLCGNDEGFYSFYRYEYPSGRFKAFAGREFDLPMKDGSITHCDGQWWDGGAKTGSEILKVDLETTYIVTISELKKYSTLIYPTHIEKDYHKLLLADFDGFTYPMDDYLKVIDYDDIKKSAYIQEIKSRTKIRTLKRINGHIINNAKNLSKELKQLRPKKTHNMTSSEKFVYKLNSMEPGDFFNFCEGIQVLKVPSGFIYQFYNLESGDVTSSQFVEKIEIPDIQGGKCRVVKLYNS